MQPVGASVTALRVEGFGPSVAERLAMLRARFSATMPAIELSEEGSRTLWLAIRDVAPFFAADRIVWRLSVPPGEARANRRGSIACGALAEAAIRLGWWSGQACHWRRTPMPSWCATRCRPAMRLLCGRRFMFGRKSRCFSRNRRLWRRSPAASKRRSTLAEF